MSFAQHVIDALGLGGLYALLALGISLQFGVMRLMNFAYGELLMIGGYASLLVGQGLWLVRIPIVVAIVVGGAVIMERIAFRPVRGALPSTLLITSFALSYLLQSLASVALGAAAKPVPWPAIVSRPVRLGSLHTSALSLATIVIAAITLAGLGLVLQRTRLGIEMRAAADDFDMARHLGVRSNQVIMFAFAVSGVVAAIGSLLYVAQSASVNPTMGVEPVLIAFVAAVIGGLGSPVGAVVGGIVLGILTTILQVTLPTSLAGSRDAVLFALVIVVLLFRPNGILARSSVPLLLSRT